MAETTKTSISNDDAQAPISTEPEVTPEEEAKGEIARALFDKLKADLQERVKEERTFSLCLEQKTGVNGTGSSGRWTVTFEFEEKEHADESFSLRFELHAQPPNGESKFVGKAEARLEIHDEHIIRLWFSQGKTFKLIEIEGSNDVEEDNALSLSYKSVRSEILEVWFPPDSKASALEYPIELCEDHQELTGSPNWAGMKESVKVTRPLVKVGDEDGSFTVDTDSNKWWTMIRSIIAYWSVSAIYTDSGDRMSSFPRSSEEEDPSKESEEKEWGLPSKNRFQPSRPVNLKPGKALSKLEDDGLFFPWHVIESACAALNAGKNVIFTGPPGCGKSKLATFLAQEATGQDPLMATASPAWTAGDLLGRYMPSRDGNGLVFREGFFLRAIPRNGVSKWLIIDEFNRADIDSCFGELFSVLAGDAVQLPFEQLLKGEDSNESGDASSVSSSFVRVVPASAQNEEKEGDYRVPNRFRMIGTMNDADRSGLNNLSFALMRRFAFIPVEAPDRSTIRKIIKKGIKSANQDLNLDKYSWFIVGDKKSSYGESKMDKIENELNLLFANSESEWGDLVSSRAVGVSVIQDIIRFVGEGMRSSGTGDKRYVDFRPVESEAGSDRNHVAEVLSLSYLALALVLQVFPQLESLGRGTVGEEDKLMQAVKHIFESIHTDDNGRARNSQELPMLRIAAGKEDRKSEDRILESDQTIAEFLFDNLKTRLPHVDPTQLRTELAQWLDEDDN